MTSATVVVAASGNLASANEYVRSGSSAMPVPNARTPNPSQIQSTNGLTTTCRLIVCVPKSKSGGSTR